MSTLRPGDIVSRRKGPVMHRGVVTADGRILHSTPLRGEHLSTPAEFRAGRRLHVTRNDCEHRAQAARYAAPDIGRSYHLLTNNCEHTVCRARDERPESPQLRSWAVGITLAAVGFAVTRHPAVAAAGYALGRSLAGRT